MLAAFNVTAQVDGFQLPYNPDSEPDGYIGVGDVLEVLSIFGSQWNASDIYLSNDSTSMTMLVGQLIHPLCLAACADLPGSWQMASLTDLGRIWDELPAGEQVWFHSENTVSGLDRYYVNFYSAPTYSQNPPVGSSPYYCYCSTHERPKVEYSICKNTVSQAPFEQCCSSKVAEGWYPLSSNPVSGGSSAEFGQAFWRWVD